MFLNHVMAEGCRANFSSWDEAEEAIGVWKWEIHVLVQGTARPTEADAKRISRKLQIPLSDLFDDAPDDRPLSHDAAIVAMAQAIPPMTDESARRIARILWDTYDELHKND